MVRGLKKHKKHDGNMIDKYEMLDLVEDIVEEFKKENKKYFLFNNIALGIVTVISIFAFILTGILLVNCIETYKILIFYLIGCIGLIASKILYANSEKLYFIKEYNKLLREYLIE